MTRQAALCLLLAGLLAACAALQGGDTAETLALRQSLAPSRAYPIGGVTYMVSRRPEAHTGVRVRTRDGRNGTSQGAYTAAIRAYGCQSLVLKEVVPVWRVAEGHGTLCEFDRSGGVNR